MHQRLSKSARRNEPVYRDGHGNAQRLRWLVNDLLMLFDIDQKHVNTFREQIDPQFDFRQPIDETIKWWQPRGITAQVEVASDIRIHAPKLGFRQAVVHLVDNACKFSPRGGKVTITLMSKRRWRLQSGNQRRRTRYPGTFAGKGVRTVFSNPARDSREYNGLGVGLTIARAFARSLGGDVTILDSAKGYSVQMVLPPAPNDWTPDTQLP